MDQATAIRQLLCPKQQWVNDKDVTKCKTCQRVFVPLFVWKHHCRFCGCVFCNNCAANILSGESINYDNQKRLRHCDPCHQRIQMVLKRQSKDIRRQSNLFNPDQTVIMIQIDDPDSNHFAQQRQTHQNLRDLMSQNKLALERKALIILKTLAEQLCDKYGLQGSTWKLRLAEIAWQAVIQTKPQIFIRKQPWSLNRQIRVITILAPNEAVASVCVRGLVMERNIPSKQFQTHMRYPRIVTIRSAIQAQSLVQNNQVRFDEMVRNEGIILRGCLQKVFGLCPNIMFVQQNVSKGAMELAQQRNIMVISKVKPNDLQKIERLSMIKKRIDNILAIDRHQPGDMIGCCEKVYFKTVRTGEMLMFIQHQAGIRTVLIGDTTENSNESLKKVMDLLLKMAWNLKMERELVVRDVRIGEMGLQLSSVLLTSYQQKKYGNQQMFMQSQDILTTKIVYKIIPSESTNKSFQQYLKIRGGRRILLQICGKTQIFTNKLYCGEEMSVGTFIMKCAIEGVAGCNQCNSQHLIRFYLNSYCINVKVQVETSKKTLRLSPVQDEEEQQPEKNTKIFEQRENVKLYAAITQFLHTFRLQSRQSPSKLLFLMYFECSDCGKVLGDNKARIGNDFLIMSLHHFLLIITRTAQNMDKITEVSNKCEHNRISRVIQCPRAKIKFTAHKVEKHTLSDICFNEAIVKRLQSKDEAMVSQLFKKSLIEKMTCIQTLQIEMAKLPFASGVNGISFSTISISGASAHAHMYYQPFSKIETVIQELRQTINMIQMDKQIEQGMMDWTVLMRKFSKIDHVIKIVFEVVNFITNALKKLKIQQTFHSSEDLLMMNSPNFQNSPLRKFSDGRIETQSFKTHSIASQGNLPINLTQSMAYLNTQASFVTTRTTALRKETSFYIQTQFDSYLKKLRRHRFLKFQGAYLYYPIGNIEDPVSLLACCLNSDQFKENLKEPIYKDTINLRINFYRELKSDWPPYLQASKVYKQLTKEDASKGDNQQVGFSIYHHKQFEQLRSSEGIDFRLYIRSLYGCQSWDSSGGKSNSSFSKAHNQTLVVKIINEKQFVEFQKFAQAYLKYMRYKREAKETSYLAKIFGIYEVLIRNKVYKCVVMQNVFFGLDKIKQVYDLKGSEVNRLAQPVQDKSFTGLDTNFIIDKDGQPYLLQPNVYDKVSAALNEDALFLKDQGVIDYSLLVIESENTLRMAIIDFMRPYHFVQKIQTIYKQIKSGKDPTVIPPQQYAQRFVLAMKRYFTKVN